ncbi:hypothetical protein ACEN2P_10795 [Pedobacter psychrotolerans]|uniref:hypothetical protein n=1 Tax=Pedobacter psychrotolerans TaxID=1843235 RepID=UPI003F9CDDC3
MSIIIKYKNLSGEQITRQQAQNIKDYYFKEEYDGNLDLRKRISYDQGEIFHVIHYLKMMKILTMLLFTRQINMVGEAFILINK